MCFCDHRFKEHEYLESKNKKVTPNDINDNNNNYRCSVRNLNVHAPASPTSQSLDPVTSSASVNTPTLNTTQSLRNVVRVCVVVISLLLGGHVPVVVSMENIRLYSRVGRLVNYYGLVLF